jgi:DNA-binding GntR family transcriptional regulator
VPPAPLERVSIVDALSRALRRRILDGELVPGERLRELDISAAYEVGRYTVRAAFQELVHGGMAERLPHRGVSVADPGPADMRDVYTFRAALEAEAAHTIVERGLPIDRVLEALARLEDVSLQAPWYELLEADLAVHRALVDAAGSGRLSVAFGSIADQVLLCLSTITSPTDIVAADHRALVDGLRSGDGDRAVCLVRVHLQDAVDQMVAADAGRRARRAAIPTRASLDDRRPSHEEAR